MNILKKIESKIFRKYIFPKVLSKILIKSKNSKAHSKFCEQVYGKNLTQLNMANMEQINKLIEILKLSENSKVLDLGCASGTVTEYISDLTKAHVTGIDYVKNAINIAKERTVKKSYRLTFKYMNFNNLKFPDNFFDVIIAIDSIYFVDDFEKTIGNLKKILKSNGEMAIFFTQTIKINESSNILLPNNTKIAIALKKNKLNYEFYDFTELEKNHWKISKEVAENLKEDFIEEKNFDIYRIILNESKNQLKFVESNRISRYLYFIKT